MNVKEKKRYVLREVCYKVMNCNLKQHFSMKYLNYFPDRSKSWDIKYRLKPLGKIAKNDFNVVVNNLNNYYKGVHFLETLKLYINDINGMVKDTVIYMNKPDYDIGYILSNYLEYWENLNMIIQFGLKGNKTEKIVKENGELLLEQKLKLNRKEVMNLIFWSNMEKSKYKTYSELVDAVVGLGLMEEDSMIDVRVYYFNRGASKTRDDMDFLLKRLTIEEKNGSETNTFGIFNYNGTICFSQMALNPSNFIYFNEVCLKRFLEKDNDGGKLLFLAIRNFLLEKVSPMDIKRFLLFSSIILYFYGLRRPSDIDFIGYDLPKATGGLEEIYKEYGTTGKEIIAIGELQVRGYGDWRKGEKKEYLMEWFGYQWANMFGAKDLADMIFNPRYYINIMGMKVIRIEADMERRRIRHRPASYADLIAYNKYMPIPINIEEPPLKYYSQGKEEMYDTPETIQHLLRKIKNYLRLRYDIKMTVEEIAQKLNLSSERAGFYVKKEEKHIDERMRKRLAIYDKLISKVKE